MAECVTGTRKLSENLFIEWEPCGSLTEPHEVELYFQSNGGTLSGTFVLWVDGVMTAPITYDATVLTLQTNISNALTAAGITSVTAAVSGSRVALTAAAVGYHDIRVLYANTLVNADKAWAEVLTQGSQIYSLSAALTAFNWEKTRDVVDQTPLNQRERVEVASKEDMTFEITLFDTTFDIYRMLLDGDQNGKLTVYDWGKVDGGIYFAITALIDSVGKDYPDGEKLEVTVSGVRQGPFLIPLNTVYSA